MQNLKHLPRRASAALVLMAAVVVQAAPSVTPCAKPVYPPDALRQEQSGKVGIKFKIARNGKVAAAVIDKSSGFPLLDNAARDALSLCTFRPGPKPDKAGASWVKVQYVWTLEDTSPDEWAAQWAAARSGDAAGDRAATFRLGMLYLAGGGEPPDVTQGLALLEKSAGLGHLPALETLGELHANGANVARDMIKAQAWLLAAAQAGSSHAQASLGRMLLKGDGIEARPEEGIEWLRKSASSGSSEGRSYLAVELMARAGEHGDLSEALALLHQAAAQNDRYAQTRLGYVYRFGRGVKADPVKAAALFEQAAQAGGARCPDGTGGNVR